MNDTCSRAQASKYYQMLKAFIDMKNSESESTLDEMHNSVLSLKWMTRGRDVKALDPMINSRIWMTRATIGRDLWALDAMISSKLWRK